MLGIKNKIRTRRQNKALHLFFQHVADSLNDAGLDMKAVLKPEVDIPWSKDTVKEYLWRPIMRIFTNKESTTEMTTKELDEILDILTRHLGEKFGVKIKFPSIDEVMYKDK